MMISGLILCIAKKISRLLLFDAYSGVSCVEIYQTIVNMPQYVFGKATNYGLLLSPGTTFRSHLYLPKIQDTRNRQHKIEPNQAHRTPWKVVMSLKVLGNN